MTSPEAHTDPAAGRPVEGPGSLGRFLPRIGALLIDWFLCSLIAAAFLDYRWGGSGAEGFKPLLVFAIENFLLVSTIGMTIGHRIFGLVVQRPDATPPGLVSGAVRTRETWERLHEDFGDVEVRYEPGLYNASAERLRRSVEAAGDEAGCLLILAHNPGVHLLAVKYLEEAAASPRVLERLSVGFPPAACAVFAVDPAGRPVFESLLTPRAAGVAG